MTKKKSLVLFSVIIILTLTIKIINFSFMENSPLFYNPILDEYYHHYTAKNMVEKGFLSFETPYYRAPLYIYTLAFVYKIAGINILYGRLINLIIGILIIILIYLTTRIIFNDTVALISSLVFLFYPITLVFDFLLHTTNMEMLFSIAGLFFLIKAIKNPRCYLWVISGIFFGLGAITKPIVIPIAIILILTVLFFYRKDTKTRLKYTTLFIISVIIIITPITMINLIEGEDLVLVSWTGGVNFYLGNNELSTGLTVYSPEIKSVFSDQFSTITDIPETELGKDLKKSQVSRFWLDKGLDYIKKNPLDWFKLMVKKKVLLFNNTEMANIYHFKAIGEFSPILNIPFPNYAFIFAFGIVGLIFVRKNLSDFYIPLLFIFTYSVIIIFFFVNTRYRIPPVPILAIFTGYGIYSIYKYIREKKIKRLIIALVVVIILSIFSYHNFYHIKELSHNRFTYYSNLGDIYRENNKTTEAIEYYEKALDYPVQSPELNQSIHNRLGILYKNKGNREKSFYHFSQSLSRLPSITAYNHLALHHLEDRELTRAERNLKKSLQLKPDNPTALHYYGLLFIYRKDYQSAVDYLERALEYNPPPQSLNNIHYNLAISLLSIGNTEQARQHLQKIEGDYSDKEIILEELSRIPIQ